MSNDVMYLGSVAGRSKSSGKDFYLLNFAVPSTRENVVGYETAAVFSDQKTFDDFRKSAKPGVAYSGIQLHYARGGWDIISYKF